MSTLLYKKVTIVGVGFMGGSLGIALRRKGLAEKVTGWGRNEGKLRLARRHGALDEWNLVKEEALAGTNLLVFSTPPAVTIQLGEEWIKSAPPGCLITDLASVKGGMVARLTELTGPARYYASSHPLCGSEKTGAAAARGDLFSGHLCLLTPVARTKKCALNELGRFWQSLGMRVVSLAPARHDEIVASVSHLPHIIASALVNYLGDKKLLDYVGTGFLDTTRIAASDPELWSEIICQNQKMIVAELDGWLKSVGELKKIIDSKNPSTLRTWLKKASLRRKKMA